MFGLEHDEKGTRRLSSLVVRSLTSFRSGNGESYPVLVAIQKGLVRTLYPTREAVRQQLANLRLMPIFRRSSQRPTKPRSTPAHSSSTNELASLPIHGTSHLSKLSASLYAWSARNAIKPKSSTSNAYETNFENEKMRWIRKRKVKRRLDCHAWNLITSHVSPHPCVAASSYTFSPARECCSCGENINIPHIITPMFQHQQHGARHGRQRHIAQQRQDIQPNR